MDKNKETGAEVFRLDEALGHVVNRAAIIIRRKLTELFKAAGHNITPEEFAIISRLWEEDGLLQSEITEKTLKDKTRVTRLLGGLIEKSLAKKQVYEEDRRNYRIYLTDKGKTLKYQLIPIVNGLMEASVRNIPKSDLEITVNTLRTIFNNLNNITDEME